MGTKPNEDQIIAADEILTQYIRENGMGGTDTNRRRCLYSIYSAMTGDGAPAAEYEDAMARAAAKASETEINEDGNAMDDPITAGEIAAMIENLSDEEQDSLREQLGLGGSGDTAPVQSDDSGAATPTADDTDNAPSEDDNGSTDGSDEGSGATDDDESAGANLYDRDELESMTVPDLRDIAADHDIDTKDMLKADLVNALMGIQVETSEGHGEDD